MAFISASYISSVRVYEPHRPVETDQAEDELHEEEAWFADRSPEFLRDGTGPEHRRSA